MSMAVFINYLALSGLNMAPLGREGRRPSQEDGALSGLSRT
jgi:hypothetical protein